MAKRPKPLTCKVCGKKFSHSAKTHPFGRLSRHMWKNHKSFMKKKQNAGKRKAKKNAVRPLDKEFMAIDDLLLSNALRGQSQYEPIHEQLGGLVLQALLPIVIEGIAKGIQKRKAKK